jgi:hypothetical protein
MNHNAKRIDLVKALVASDKFGTDKEIQQKMAIATGEMILTDLIDKAINGLAANGPGVLRVTLIADYESVEFVKADDIESDLRIAESMEDSFMVSAFRQIIHQIDTNDWQKFLLIVLADGDGIRVFPVEPTGAQENLRAIASEFTDS